MSDADIINSLNFGRSEDILKNTSDSPMTNLLLELTNELIADWRKQLETPNSKGHKPYAFVILRTGFQVSENELKQYVLNSGPAYLHPRNIEFLESFPLAGTNKIDRTTLVKKAINNQLNKKSSDSYLTGT